MPHIVAEYSANLEPQVDPRALVQALHDAALKTGVFPLGGLRTRAERRDVYIVADSDQENAFVAVVARIGHGRDEETRERVAAALMVALERETREAFRSRGLGLTVEVQEIAPIGSRKLNNLHARVARQGDAA